MEVGGQEAGVSAAGIPKPELGKPEQAYDWVDDHKDLKWMFDMSEDQKLEIAQDKTKWESSVETFREKFELLLDARAEVVREKDLRAPIIQKPYGMSCEYNYECETNCCLKYVQRNRGPGGG